jgi:hypothetical protein
LRSMSALPPEADTNEPRSIGRQAPIPKITAPIFGFPKVPP